MHTKLNPEKALIFRIVHRVNVSWILSHGIYCRNSTIQDPSYRTIGNPELIEKRRSRDVPIPPAGVLSDYVPFYFTPFSPMMYKIKSGHGGMTKVPNEDVVIFVSSLYKIEAAQIPYVFTDSHAYLQTAQFYNKLSDLSEIDWPLLRSKDFKHDSDDPGKFERYQAEALVHKHVPVEAFIGAVCYTDGVKDSLMQIVEAKGLELKVVKQTGWYF